MNWRHAVEMSVWIPRKRLRSRCRPSSGIERKATDSSPFQERTAEISVDLVLQVSAQMGDNKVHGLEDNVESELIKQLPLEKFYVIARCYQERLMLPRASRLPVPGQSSDGFS